MRYNHAIERIIYTINAMNVPEKSIYSAAPFLQEDCQRVLTKKE